MATQSEKIRAPRNRTLTLNNSEAAEYRGRLLKLTGPTDISTIANRTIFQDLLEVLEWLPTRFADLIFLDPPYNLSKSFNGNDFKELSLAGYRRWFESWFSRLLATLKPNGSVYICGDWRSSTAIHEVAERHLCVRNRITWEREKGRGALRNWKNCSEDIWFCTNSDEYAFNVDAVKLKRRVIAPYTQADGSPKDWDREENGNYRLTHPSNLWTDLTVPFWSMPENTDHPTQKPEKLLAKIILASSVEGDIIFDPFLGSGTSSVVAKKLNRRYVGIEIDETYCCLAEKRLRNADEESGIQGYSEGVFWERNSLKDQKTGVKESNSTELLLFPGKGSGTNEA
jgi:site-specific DNA-methyltransferase (adenine-specific)